MTIEPGDGKNSGTPPQQGAKEGRSEEKKNGFEYPTLIIPILDWSESKRDESLGVVYDLVTGKYRESIAWYYGKKDKKRKVAQRLRVMSIVLTVAAAIGLLVTANWAGSAWARPLGTSSSVALIFAAGLVALDRFFGHSFSWIRFVLTGLELEKKLALFGVRWNASEPTDRLEIAREAVVELFDGIELETREWADRFIGNLDKSVAELARELRDAGTGESGTAEENGKNGGKQG